MIAAMAGKGTTATATAAAKQGYRVYEWVVWTIAPLPKGIN